MKDSEIKCDPAVSTSNESILKRSFSLPLSRLKSRKDGYVGVKVHTNGIAKSDKTNECLASPTKSSSSHVSRFKRGLFSSRSMRAQLGRKVCNLLNYMFVTWHFYYKLYNQPRQAYY